MSLLSAVLVLALVGFVVWLILQIPMPQIFRTIIIAVVTIVLILWLLQALHLTTGLSRIKL